MNRLNTSLIFVFVSSLMIVFLDQVLSEPNLCKEPKIDSISYISGHDLWFFTSGGFSWLLKENQFPPNVDNSLGKLPNGFRRADATAYVDQKTVCANSDAGLEVLLIEMIDNQLKVMSFDIESSQWGSPQLWTDNRFLSKATVNSSAPIDAMFTFGSLIFIVQNGMYFNVDWKDVCSGGPSRPSPQVLSTEDLSATTDPLSAMTIKSKQIYQFSGDRFTISTFDEVSAAKGKVSIAAKGQPMSTSKDFFLFADCTLSRTLNSTKRPVPKIQTTKPNKTSSKPKLDTNYNKTGDEVVDRIQSDGTDRDNDTEDTEFVIMMSIAVIFSFIILFAIIALSVRRKGIPPPELEPKDPKPEEPVEKTERSNSVKTGPKKKQAIGQANNKPKK